MAGKACPKCGQPMKLIALMPKPKWRCENPDCSKFSTEQTSLADGLRQMET